MRYLTGHTTATGSDALTISVRDEPASVAAAAAYELIAFELRQGTTVARVDALAKWVAGNPDHRFARDARVAVFNNYLVMAQWRGQPGPKT